MNAEYKWSSTTFWNKPYTWIKHRHQLFSCRTSYSTLLSTSSTKCFISISVSHLRRRFGSLASFPGNILMCTWLMGLLFPLQVSNLAVIALRSRLNLVYTDVLCQSFWPFPKSPNFLVWVDLDFVISPVIRSKDKFKELKFECLCSFFFFTNIYSH